MKKQLKQVLGFHKKFKDIDPQHPTIDIPHIRKKMRIKLMQEELAEVVEAIENNHDISELAKELADLMYVALGTVCAYGLQNKFEEIFNEVHASNMSKIYAGEGQKPLKTESYFKADISKILNSK